MSAVHHFETTGDAYDATQCRDEIRGGDVLFIWPAGVIGIAHTWPFAVTPEYGHLHQTMDGAETYAVGLDAEEKTNVYSAGVRLARGIIAETGVEDLMFPVPAWFR